MHPAPLPRVFISVLAALISPSVLRNFEGFHLVNSLLILYLTGLKPAYGRLHAHLIYYCISCFAVSFSARILLLASKRWTWHMFRSVSLLFTET